MLFEEVSREADRRGMTSDERFSVDGALIEAAASIKSFRRRDDDDDSGGDGGVQTEDFCGEKLVQCHPHERYRSRCETDEEGQGQGREAGVHGPLR